MTNFLKKILQKIKRVLLTLAGKDFFPTLDKINFNKKRFGSGYGGWDVIIDSLSQNSVVYSFGVGEDASFDIDLIKEFGLKVFAFDPTPKSIKWVKDQIYLSYCFLYFCLNLIKNYI